MKYRDARQLVRENMEITHYRQRKPDTFVEIRATVFGRVFTEWETARYNAADKDEGLPFSAKFGMRLATGRAVKRIAKRVMRVEEMRLGGTIAEAIVEVHVPSTFVAIPEFAKTGEA